MKILTIAALLLACFSLTVCSQNTPLQVDTSNYTNDSLKAILASKTFSLEEDYSGDWGGHLHSFVFILKGNNVRVQWRNPELIEKGKDLDVLIPIKELNNFINIFMDCSAKIKTSTNKSTEHILYTFKNKNLCYVIDDKFTMECYGEFKAWKEMLLLTWKKQEKR